jgi:phenylalanyl-tRNA synthetase beta chain
MNAITLVNPLSTELEILRLSLLAGLLDAVRENAKHSDAGLWFFEVARRYLPTAGLASGTSLANERRTLGIALAGPLAHSWSESDHDADFFDLKGVITTLLDALKITDYHFTSASHPAFHPGRCAALAVIPANAGDGAAAVRVGVLGEVHPEVAGSFELSGRAYAAELDLERLYQAVPTHLIHQPIPRYPAAERDLAIVVRQDVSAAAIMKVIRSVGVPLLRDARLFDVYTGESIPAGMRSMAYALTYQSPERTLTDQEVEQAHAAIVSALRERFGAELRA